MCVSIMNIIIYILNILEITENTRKIKKTIHSHIIWGGSLECLSTVLSMHGSCFLV